MDDVGNEPVTRRQIAKWRRDVIEERERIFAGKLNHRFLQKHSTFYTAHLRELAELKQIEETFSND